ncbi:hypothetical protein HYS00_04490, partial [Candidatus Microgenomates bacterium]|nr:hypothetical protein [Candidatus Microgenomates bacterium]
GYINAIDDSSKFTTILDRFYNAVTQDHFYTNNAAESSNLKANGQGYVFEFPAGWTFGSQALAAAASNPPATNPPASNPPVSSGPVTNTPPQTPGNPVTSTGSGAPGYQNYTRYSLDCTNGISVASTYVADPADPTKPNIYFNVEQVTGATQSTPGTGTLLGQGVVPNGGTYNDPHVAWSSVGVPLQFYVYTFKENTDPKAEWTIHGVDATGNDVSAANGQPAPQPYSIQCPAGGTPPATPGQQTPGGGTVPPIVNDGTSPVPEGTTKTDMEITIRIKLPDGPGTVSGNAPAVPTIPVEVELTNGYQGGDSANLSVQFTWKGAGVWEGKVPAQLIPGSHFTLSIWPDKHSKKTLCQAGPNSPHVMYPTTYECNGTDGTISLKAGANLLDFSSVLIGAGDLNVDKLRDGHIDAQDLYELSQYIIKQDRNNLNAGDINMDGVVNQRDYDLAVWSLENVTQ